MAQINLQINGREYNMACDDGDEDRLYKLAGYLNERLEAIAKSGAARNEMHLFMLTGLVLADEVFELKSKKGNPPQSKEQQQQAPVYAGLSPEDKEQLKSIVEGLTARVESLSQKIEKKVA